MFRAHSGHLGESFNSLNSETTGQEYARNPIDYDESWQLARCPPDYRLRSVKATNVPPLRSQSTRMSPAKRCELVGGVPVKL